LAALGEKGNKSMAADPSLTQVVQSNVEVHTRMADAYAHDEPHYRPENQAKVKANLVRVAERTGRGRMLDIGCGAGFVIDLMRDTFAEIHGIDATRAMLDRIDLSSGNVTLHEGVAEALPFEDESFDLVTAYSVFHHLADHRPVLAEAFRVLRPGGALYVDLEPNRAYWRAIEAVERDFKGKTEGLDEIVAREIQAVWHVEDDVQARFGIDPEVFRAAEYIKAHLGGFDPAEFERDAVLAGFKTCQPTYEWFLGQGQLMHGVSFDAAATTESHLRLLLPLTAHLFKYLRFEAVK
jgi:ubiquinone/menaquinone biosynthesis C-methylase UbiE